MHSPGGSEGGRDGGSDGEGGGEIGGKGGAKGGSDGGGEGEHIDACSTYLTSLVRRDPTQCVRPRKQQPFPVTLISAHPPSATHACWH